MFEGQNMSGVTRRRYAVGVGEGGRRGCPLTGIRSNDKKSEATWQAGGRNYKKGIQKETGGAAQTTLNKFWKGKEKDMRSWSEEMEELERTEKEITQNSQES